MQGWSTVTVNLVGINGVWAVSGVAAGLSRCWAQRGTPPPGVPWEVKWPYPPWYASPWFLRVGQRTCGEMLHWAGHPISQTSGKGKCTNSKNHETLRFSSCFLWPALVETYPYSGWPPCWPQIILVCWSQRILHTCPVLLSDTLVKPIMCSLEATKPDFWMFDLKHTPEIISQMPSGFFSGSLHLLLLHPWTPVQPSHLRITSKRKLSVTHLEQFPLMHVPLEPCTWPADNSSQMQWNTYTIIC